MDHTVGSYGTSSAYPLTINQSYVDVNFSHLYRNGSYGSFNEETDYICSLDSKYLDVPCTISPPS